MTRYLPTAYPNGPATYPMGLVAAGNTCHFPLSSKGERVSEIPGEPTRDVVRWVQTQVKRRERSWGFAKCTMVFYTPPGLEWQPSAPQTLETQSLFSVGHLSMFAACLSPFLEVNGVVFLVLGACKE